MHGDHPGVADAGHEPGGQGAEFARDVDVGVVEAEGGARVADVDVRGEPHLVAGLQGAVGDAVQAAYDRVGGVGRGLHDRPDDRVGAVAGEAVPARAQRGQGTGERDPARRRGVHGEPGLGGQRPAGRRLQRGVAGEPARRDGGRARGDGYGDGCGRRFDSAHAFSLPGSPLSASGSGARDDVFAAGWGRCSRWWACCGPTGRRGLRGRAKVMGAQGLPARHGGGIVRAVARTERRAAGWFGTAESVRPGRAPLRRKGPATPARRRRVPLAECRGAPAPALRPGRAPLRRKGTAARRGGVEPRLRSAEGHQPPPACELTQPLAPTLRAHPASHPHPARSPSQSPPQGTPHPRTQPPTPVAHTPSAAPPPPPPARVSAARATVPVPKKLSARPGTSTPVGRCGRRPGRGTSRG